MNPLTASARACIPWLALAVGCGGSRPQPEPAADPLPPPAPRPDNDISGIIHGHDGNPVRVGHVHVGGRSIAVGPNGWFHVPAPAPGFITLELTAVDHEPHTLGTYAGTELIWVEARLGTHFRPDTYIEVSALIYDSAPGEQPVRSHRVSLQARADGTFAADVERPPGELRYQIAGAVTDRLVNGTLADRYLYDGGGDYYSVIDVTGGRTSIVFDPDALPPPSRRPRVAVSSQTGRAARVAEIFRAHHDRQEAVRELGAILWSLPESRLSWLSAWRDEHRRALVDERDPFVRAALLITSLDPPAHVGDDPPDQEEMARRALAEVPASSTMWRMAPRNLLLAATHVGDGPEWDDRIDAALATLPDDDVTASVMVGLMRLAQHHGRADRAAAVHAAYTLRFKSAEKRRAAADFDPSLRIRRGQPVPAFDLPSADDPGVRITDTSLRGKVVLLDFWATWCAPCVAEMPDLHMLHDRFGDRFTIVSIAIDDTADNVREFRRAWKMPWLNVVPDDADQQRLKEAFEITTLPRTLVVSGDGTITAVDARRSQLVTDIMQAIGEAED